MTLKVISHYFKGYKKYQWVLLTTLNAYMWPRYATILKLAHYSHT